MRKRSERRIEVMRLVNQGVRQSQIARDLGISRQAVSQHVRWDREKRQREGDMSDMHTGTVTSAGVLCSCGVFFPTHGGESDTKDRHAAHRDRKLGLAEQQAAESQERWAK